MTSRWVSCGALLALTMGAALTGCEEKSTTLGGGEKAAPAGCDVSFASLPGSEWVFLKANPDKTEVPDHSTRLKFVKTDGKLKAKYNVGSVADMYDYRCEEKGKEVICREDPKPKDYCQAFIAGGKECTAETLKKFAPDLTDEEVQKGIKEGTEVAAKYKEDPAKWKAFQLNNNNLGNKLRGIIYVKLDPKKCRLVVQDNYMTIYNGKKIEDSNPAGVNPFVKNEMGELLWEHCKDRRNVVATKAAELPENLDDLAHEAKHAVGADVHLWYMEESARKPAEGCSYSYDVWLDGKPLKKGLAPEVQGEGDAQSLKWHFAHKFADPSATGAGNALHYVVNKKCADKSEKKVACAAVLIQ